MKRSDVPVIDVLRAHNDYRVERDAALASRGATNTILAFQAMLAPEFPRITPPYQRLIAAGFPYKVVMARIMQLVDKRLLEYGTSPHTAWLTHEGRRMLADAGE